ncbi:aminotransferase class I/II-fold pyridoxal phosphate-dependent enzyme [Fodinibius saliphilus]|uniref:aminotransferase class I/II-fold pyridoxal phosphate-dependent enzyme n=1 Tax=Fodinibius saliphilus TaxID=1920650 RepID=UPI0011086365|nr:8-amino-7-oxononanoate synthase [Fodinibius saliphilus]
MSSSQKYDFVDKALAKRKKRHQFRELTSFIPSDAVTLSNGDKQYLNFSGNDYLGLSHHPKVTERSQLYTEKYGAGATASRLINGTFDIHDRLERKLAQTFGWESALVFNSGFQANSTIISTLTDRHSLILADKLSHRSLLQGSLASRAAFRRFKHNSVTDLADQLKNADEEDFSRIIVVTESLFSMDGDCAELQKIADLCNKFGALLFVDDAHAVGVWGEQGLGFTHSVKGIDIVLATCGKAFGAFGAFVLCGKEMRDYLLNFCPGFIYTTALPPAVIGAVDASLELIPNMDSEREELYKHIKIMQKGITEAGFSIGSSQSQIIPIMVGSEENALNLAEFLKNNGFLATAIRPPTVPRGSARIRITLSSHHKKGQIEEFLTALNRWSNG